MALILDKIGIVTGNTVEAYHVTQSIDAFTGIVAYDIDLSGSMDITGPTLVSGSLQVTGSVAINGLTNPSKTNVLTYDTTTGQIFYTASNALPDQMVDTSSFITSDQTGSFSTGSSYVSSSILTPGVVGGNEITFFKGDGTTHMQIINTGSSYISSSILNPGEGGGNEITFNLSDGTTQTQTIHPGSSGGGGGMTWQNVEVSGPTTIGSGDQGFVLFGGVNIRLALPATSNVGDTIEVIHSGSGWSRIEAGAGQIIFAGGTSTSLSGQMQTVANKQSCYQLVCTSPNTMWRVTRYTDDDVFNFQSSFKDPSLQLTLS